MKTISKFFIMATFLMAGLLIANPVSAQNDAAATTDQKVVSTTKVPTADQAKVKCWYSKTSCTKAQKANCASKASKAGSMSSTASFAGQSSAPATAKKSCAYSKKKCSKAAAAKCGSAKASAGFAGSEGETAKK